MKGCFFAASLALIGALGITTSPVAAQAVSDTTKPSVEKPIAPEPKADAATPPVATPPAATPAPTAAPAQPSGPNHAQILKDFKPVAGLIPLFHKDIRLIAEISPQNLNRDFIILISIARGISQGQLLAGMSWGFGDDWIWQFRKADDRILVVRRNVRFRANPGSPEARAVELGYTDSVMFALPIMAPGPNGGSLVELTPVFMSDLPQISQVLRGYMFTPQKSTWASVKGFEKNVEIEVAASYSGGGGAEIETVPDSRAATINVHYSISHLPSSGYTPRLADPRVGYFVTALKDFSKKESEDRFVRYINRWDLQKADSQAAVSSPKKPIVFWIEKTVPFKYRKPIHDGIAEWNKAFEKAGFYDAIDVRQQPDDATWDPEDINYNTFRWITAGAGMAMGPSRVNPQTGQILDADIIFDADFLQHWKMEFETYTPKAAVAMFGDGPWSDEALAATDSKLWLGAHGSYCGCSMHRGFAHELAFGAVTLFARPHTEAEMDKLIVQGLKEVTMHEVGHTLGLRHNFKASTLYNLADLNNPEKTKQTGIVASVMDYSPTNLVPKDAQQGDYYSSTIGPYDYWAIEYGYKPIGGGSPEAEQNALKAIAARSGEPGLAYLTDEDTRGLLDPDPLSNRFDLGSDTIAFARQRAQLISELWPGLVERVVGQGEGYQKARRAFNVLLTSYGRAMMMAARNVGGVYVSRSHRGDAHAKAPYTVVDPAKQREALQLLEENVLSDKPFNFPPQLYNHLATTRWYHWGSDIPSRDDFAVHETILMWQDQILGQLLSSMTMRRLHDSELKVAADQDSFTTPELFGRVTKAVFAELDAIKPGEYTNRKPAISSMRRGLQRALIRRLGALALGSANGVPEDCETMAYSELSDLQGRIDGVLAKNGELKLDPYSKAHLAESSARIKKIIEARLQMSRP
jgi:hypothetical protein